MNYKKVLVLAGGRSSEYDVSISSANQVISNLNKEKYISKLVTISKEEGDIEFVKEIQEFKPDVVFIAMHGSFGEDGRLQGLLDFLGVPYVGSGVLASSVGMEKCVFKRYISTFDVLLPKWETAASVEELEKKIEIVGWPCVVKPINGGSSIGVTILKDKNNIQKAFEEALEGNEYVLVEEYIKGMEVTCGVIGNEEKIALPLVEIVPKSEFFDYEAKYSDGASDEIVPARINDDITNKVKKESLKVYEAVGARDFARVDFLIKDNTPYLLEINTIPGLTPNSLLPKEARAVGIEYPELLDKLIEMALKRA